MNKILKVISIIVILLAGFNLQKPHASAENFHREGYEQGLYQQGAPMPYGSNISYDSPYASTDDSQVSWIFGRHYEDEERGIKAFHGSPAIDKDGTIYINSHDSILYAFNPDGSVKWSFDEFTNSGYGTSVTIAEDGTILVAIKDLYAINPDGTLKWKVESPSLTNSHFYGPAIDEEGTIFVFSYGDKSMYSFNSDGTLKHKGEPIPTTYGGIVKNDTTIMIGKNGLLYFVAASSSKRSLIAVDKNGQVAWAKVMPSTGEIYPTLDRNGDIYLSATSSAVGGIVKVYKINGLTGETLIEKSLVNSARTTPPTIDNVDGSVYLSANKSIWKLDADLNILWENTEISAETSAILVDKNQNIIFTTAFGVFKLNKNGEEVWHTDRTQLTETNSMGRTSYAPSIDSYGNVYTNYSSGNLYNFVKIGDGKPPLNYCTYYEMIGEKLNNQTLTEEERNAAIKETEELLERLKAYTP